MKESSIPLAVLYNTRVERIRVLEYEKNYPPQPVHFDISESYSGAAKKRLVKIYSDTVPEPHHFDIDLEHGKGPKIYETKLESVTRASRFKKNVQLNLSDYIRDKNDKTAVAKFVADMEK